MVRLSRIYVACRVAHRHHGDLVRGFAVDDLQRTRRSRCQVVVGCHVRAAGHHLEVVAVASGVGAHERSLCGRVGDGRRMSGEYVVEHAYGVTLMFVAVIFHIGDISHGDRDGALGDGEVVAYYAYDVV